MALGFWKGRSWPFVDKLRSIFSKTGVRRQTELVRIMLNSVVALGAPQPVVNPASAKTR